MKYNYGKKQRGVTLVEIAIVLVIIGLLLGGILKGQELINNAKVRSIADRQNSIKAAWFSFIDRYQALPGDYRQAQQNVPGAGPALDLNVGATGEGFGDGTIIDTESPYAMQHLTGAGYLRCPQCTYAPAAALAVLPSADNSLQNQYGGVMAIFVDGAGLGSAAASTDTYVPVTAGDRRPRLGVHTGSNIPSNIIAEVDRKLDDGSPETGDFRASDYSTTALKPAVNCLDSDIEADAIQANGNYDGLDTPQGWRHASVPPEQNCGGFVFI